MTYERFCKYQGKSDKNQGKNMCFAHLHHSVVCECNQNIQEIKRDKNGEYELENCPDFELILEAREKVLENLAKIKI